MCNTVTTPIATHTLRTISESIETASPIGPLFKPPPRSSNSKEFHIIGSSNYHIIEERGQYCPEFPTRGLK